MILIYLKATKKADILCSIINRELQKISFWLSSNKRSLNIKKTHCLVFKTTRKWLKETRVIKINGKIIKIS